MALLPGMINQYCLQVGFRLSKHDIHLVLILLTKITETPATSVQLSTMLIG